MRMEYKQKRTWAAVFGLVCLVAGIVLNALGVGSGSWFAGFGSVGNWLIYIGVVSFLVLVVRSFRKPRKVDERMLHVANQAGRMTLVAFFVMSLAVMVWDGIAPITLPYRLFMSYLVCGVMLFYMGDYIILLGR